MSRKILPVNLKPYAKTFHHLALPLSAITAENKNMELYAINTFGNVYYAEKVMCFHKVPTFETWPCIDTEWLTPGFFSSRTKFVQLMIDAMEEGWYIYTHVNEQYIPHRKAYQTEELKHNILVHGYRAGYDGDVLYVLGYCDNGEYKTTTVPLDMFEQSLYRDERVRFFKAKSSYENKLDKELNLTLFQDYLESRGVPFNDYSTEEISFGLKAVERLCNELLALDYFDLRSWDMLYQHKRLMYEKICRFSDLVDTGDIQAPYQDILEQSKHIRSLALKHLAERTKGIADHKDTKQRMADMTLELLKSEEIFLRQFVEKLNGIEFPQPSET